MKIRLLLPLIVFSLVLIPLANKSFAEELFDGYSSIDPPLSEIISEQSTVLNIRFLYTSGPYAINDFVPVIDVSPSSAKKFVQVDVDSIETRQGQVKRIPVTLTIDPYIEHDKIFLGISFTGNHFQTDELYKSSWNDQVALDIVEKDIPIPEPEQDRPVHENCGPGTILQDGICIVEQQPVKTNSSGMWGMVLEYPAPSTQIENINGTFYYVSEPFDLNLKLDAISFLGISFVPPYTTDPPRHIYSDVIFPDETKETLSVIFDEPDFTKHVKPQAGLVQRNDGYHLLVSVNLKELSPLKQFKSGIPLDEIECRESFILVTKHNSSPACIKSETTAKLIERGWSKTTTLQETEDPDSFNLNIVQIEDGRISLYPENTCASIHVDLLSDHDIQRYKNDKKGLNESNVLHISSDHLKETPIIHELIYAVHSIDFPHNKHSSIYLDGLTFVEYEFFLMNKAIRNYGDSQEDYFIKLDSDYEERFANPAKQGFSNTFEAPIIFYNSEAYSVSGTVFWTSDEHEPMKLTVSPKHVVDNDEKFIILTEDDLKSIPKIKEAVDGIGTIEESVTGIKGLPEDEWNKYIEWFEQTSLNQLGTDSFRLMEYKDQLYSIGFGIC